MFSIPMALADFIPVLFFGAAALLLQKDLYNKMSKGAYALLCAGTIDVFMAGALKALYKLLYAAGICDFEALSKLFFPLQALGFILAGVSIVCMLKLNQGSGKVYSAAPVFFSGTFVFVTLMVLGLGCIDAGLSVVAAKLKKKKAIILFAISFVFSLMMGYLSSKDFAQSYMNWAAELVNIIGQGALFAGVLMLHKNGLNELELKEH